MSTIDARPSRRASLRRFVAACAPSGGWHCQDTTHPTVFGVADSPERALATACRLAGLDPTRFRVVEQSPVRVVYVERSDGSANWVGSPSVAASDSSR